MKAVRSFVWLSAACAVASGCSTEGKAPAADDTEQSKVVLDPATATNAADYLGTYDLVYEDGTKATVSFVEGGKVEAKFGDTDVTATYTVPASGKVCFDKVSTGDPPHCWRNGKADQSGAWTALMDDDSKVSITPAP